MREKTWKKTKWKHVRETRRRWYERNTNECGKGKRITTRFTCGMEGSEMFGGECGFIRFVCSGSMVKQMGERKMLKGVKGEKKIAFSRKNPRASWWKWWGSKGYWLKRRSSANESARSFFNFLITSFPPPMSVTPSMSPIRHVEKFHRKIVFVFSILFYWPSNLLCLWDCNPK